MSDLFDKLAEAYARPSGAYRAASAALDIPNQGLEGYLQGAEAGDVIRKRNLGKKTLSEVLGGKIIPGLESFSDTTVDAAKAIEPFAKFKSDGLDALLKMQLTQDNIMKRQKDRQNFAKDMLNEKGNRTAVSDSQDINAASVTMNNLNEALDKLPEGTGDFYRRRALSPAGRLFNPEIFALRQNIRLRAGFSTGGKNLTGTELGVVVGALEPTMTDNTASRRLKNRLFQDWASGKVNLFDTAKLLGPAGTPLVAVANAQKARQMAQEQRSRATVAASVAGGGDPSGDLDSLYGSEGL